ncbi:MAG: hypothetical protein EON58_22175 [Alphaproteobacteria bacterium]|nr:MAG: hypothetical protein EON58_22175 [Alphaproteobacteria bacterium]
MRFAKRTDLKHVLEAQFASRHEKTLELRWRQLTADATAPKIRHPSRLFSNLLEAYRGYE